MGDGGFDEGEIPFYLPDSAADFQHDVITGRDRGLIFHVQFRSHSGGLQPAVHDQSAKLVEKCRLDASGEGFQPSLIFVARGPYAYDVVPVFMKFHFQSGGIRRAAGETIVALVFKADVWILYLFHHVSIFCANIVNFVENVQSGV